MKFIRLGLGLAIIASMVALLWATTEAYRIGFGASEKTAGWLHIGSIIFSGLFLFSFWSGRFRNAEKIRILYKLFNIFIAFIFYLFPAAVALSIVLALGVFSPQTTEAISALFVTIALVLGFIGVIQSRIITVTGYRVTLPNAPMSWNGKRAVLVTDTHFGLVNNRHISRTIVSRIEALNPDFVLHAGDFYDGPTIDTKTVTEPWKNLASRIPIFYTPGNHEHYGDYEQFIFSLKDIGATVLLDDKTVYDGVVIAGILYRIKPHRDSAYHALENLSLDPLQPTILINHPPFFHEKAREMGVDLMISGHTHRGQFWLVNYIVRMLYGKYIYGLHTVGSMTAITSSGVGTAGPMSRLFNPPELVVLTFQTRT